MNQYFRFSLFVALYFLISVSISFAEKGYPEQVQPVEIKSSADGVLQNALYFSPKVDHEVPLLVALHTWSSDWKNTHNVPLAEGSIERGWAFIHPDFRGPNRRPEACGSDLAVSDIIDAVNWVQKKTKIDKSRIYLAGVSGGGHMALQMAGRAPQIWAGVSSWVPITDCAAWHRECVKSGRKYYNDLEKSCGGKPSVSPAVEEEYKRRSPLTWLGEASKVPIDINAGITDGHTGSVPISHSLRAFNLLAKNIHRITDEEIKFFTEKSEVPESLAKAKPDPSYGEDHQPLWRSKSNMARVTIFDGGHQMIPTAIFAWLGQQEKK
tara:strand:+ start:663 stop:1631 length:969 start_codon:yes stop_codon:yes gene_type:complete